MLSRPFRGLLIGCVCHHRYPFITDEGRIAALCSALGLRAGERLSYFEALAWTRIVYGTVSSYELVAVRRH